MNRRTSLRTGAAVLLFLLVLASCDMLVGSEASDNSGVNNPAALEGLWTWISGSNVANRSGIYGTQGVATAGNVPGARSGAASWIDTGGNLWLFGGFGRGADGSLGELNDLWRYDGANWMWVSGGFEPGAPGEYGTKGVATAANVPPARSGAASWIDDSGNLWLFGGSRFGINGDSRLNDLWRFDGSHWTWISGDDGFNQAGTYGTKGVPAVNNVPGARAGAASWVDSAGRFWLFGGAGRDSAGSVGDLNDLWRFDGLNWTWVSGDDAVNQSGEYPEEGPSLVERLPGPGARSGAASWIDGNDNLFLFGGLGFDGDGARGRLNDLWYFDGSDWFWISGADTVNHPGSYGTKGVASPDDLPEARSNAAYWADESDNLWLFGGAVNTGSSTVGRRNDLWRFDGELWIWVSGSESVNQSGVYGVQGSPSGDNVPGARSGTASWIDAGGDLWLFGGRGQGATSSVGDHNDLWRFQH